MSSHEISSRITDLPNEPLGAVHQEVPCPVTEEQILFHVPLHNWNHILLVDQLLVLHPSSVPSGQALDVVEDGLDAFLSAFFNTTYSTSAEEDLGMAQSPLVVHGLNGGKNDLGGFFEVRQGGVNFLWLDDDEAMDKVRIHSPDMSIY